MIAAIKSEFRKLLTVRSTYVLFGLAVILVVFFGFYIEGVKLAPADLNNPAQLASDITGALGALVIFGALAAVLLMTHEYRYNTIMYTLTSNRSRSNVLLAKIFVVSVFALIFTGVIAALSPLMSYLGVQASGHTLVPQSIPYGDLWWRVLLFGWGYGMVGLLLATLIRSQVGTIVALFLIPGVVEQLIALLLKDKAVYMPFSSLDHILSADASAISGNLSPGTAAAVFLSYLVFFWLVAWVLFLRRDAN